MAKYEDVITLKDKVSKTLVKMTAKMGQFDKQVGKATATLEKFTKRGENIKKVGKSFQDFGNKMTLGVTLPIVALGGAMVKAAADMEAMQQQLSTMLQSEEKGAKMFADIKKIASQTPMETKDLMQATNTMLGFGIAQEKVLPLMKQLGDISGGNADRFQSLALAFSQVSSAGKLQGQDLMQMINAGFNPLEAISKRTGKSIGQLKDEMSKGKITIKMVEEAMKDATSQGGRFFGMMEKQSKTALGQWSTMQDNLNQTLAEFGVQIMPYVIKAMQGLTKILEKFNSLSPATKKTLVILAGIVAIIPPLVTFVGTLITAVGGLTTAFGFLAVALGAVSLPMIGIGIAIAAVIAGIIALIKWIRKLKGEKDFALNIGAKFNQDYGSKIAGNKGFGGYYNQNSSVNNSNNTTTTNNYYNMVNPAGNYLSPMRVPAF